jgi:hypothetical protein
MESGVWPRHANNRTSQHAAHTAGWEGEPGEKEAGGGNPSSFRWTTARSDPACMESGPVVRVRASVSAPHISPTRHDTHVHD